MSKIKSRYDLASQQYKECGVDTQKAIDILRKLKISIHCWQGDDVTGFEVAQDGSKGGIAATGRYLGKARNIDELRQDIEKALSLIPGKHKLSLHAIYADTHGKPVDRADLGIEHFKSWVDWAKQHNVGLDFNPTFFMHKNASDGLTLSHPDKHIRDYWVQHGKNSRKISEHFGKELGQASLNNVWIPDGYKDTPSDRLSPRIRLKESLDSIFAEQISDKYNLDAVESKVFGIGVESYTVGSHEFYMNYAMQNKKMCLLDNGHYHPTESVADKIPSLLLFSDKVALHVTRPVRWDSDHVVTFNDDIREIAKEIVRNDAIDRVLIGLDFFDASINRISAWVIGARAIQKALLEALLMPHDKLREYQDKGDFTSRLAIQEELKTYPLGDVWNYFCSEVCDVPAKEDWLKVVQDYERDVLSKRG